MVAAAAVESVGCDQPGKSIRLELLWLMFFGENSMFFQGSKILVEHSNFC